MAMSIRTDSTEYVTGTVTVDHDISGITGEQLQVAVPKGGETPDTWYNTVVDGVVENSGKWTATYRILMGPTGGTFSCEPGKYDWTLKITDDPEVPIRKVTTITVTAS